MLKEYLLASCQTQYQNSCAGNCGSACDNPFNCKGACDAPGGCLDQVHWYPNRLGRTDYSCEYLLRKYVLTFTERYERQIIDVFRCIDMSQFPGYNILSLGCGGAPDLMAFEEMTNGLKYIHYSGIDKNPKWQSIHSILQYYCDSTGIDAKFAQEDVFTVLESPNFPAYQYNIIVIQYMLSHLYNTGQDQKTDELFDRIINSVLPARLPNSPFLIIICDVDSINKGRKKWFSLLDKLEQNGYCGHAVAKSYYTNGDLGVERWSRNKASPLFGNICYQFVQNTSEHDGAQLIIELE